MPHTQNSVFLGRLLHGAQGYGWVCAFSGNPGSDQDARWHGRPWLPSPDSNAVVDGWGDQNTYFCVAELKEVGGGRARKAEYFSRLLALVVDDAIDASIIGTPTWVLETSPGKVQVGVFIDREDPDAANPQLVTAVMHELYQRGLVGDKSGNNLVRYVRQPQGTNAKPRPSGPFQHNLTFWQPEQVLSLADACAVFGMDLDEIRARPQAAASEDGTVYFGDAGQDEVMAECVSNIIEGVAIHESLLRLSGSMARTNMYDGAQVNMMRAVLSKSKAPRDGRWQERYDDIPRLVEGANKFKPAARPALELPPAAEPGEPVEEEPLLVRVGDAIDDITPIDWLVKGWLEREAISMVYGPPHAGKSFVVYDWACCVATGSPWNGRPVRQGPVIIVIGEGKGGIRRRMKAWSVHNGVSLKGQPLYHTTAAVPMLDASAVWKLVESVDAVIAQNGGEYPAMIQIDTLARNFGPGDENSTEDANAFVAAVAALARRYRCHVMVVHHSGKNVAAGARGSSAFRGAMDQEFAVATLASVKVIKLVCTKMKDAETPDPMEFRLEKIEIGVNPESDEPIMGAALKIATSLLDESIYTMRDKSISLGFVLKMGDGHRMPPATTIGKALGITSNKGLGELMKRLQAGGWIEPDPNAPAKRMLTHKALMALNGTGGLLGTSETPAGEEEVDDDL